jgi:hypothetical protein
MKRLFSILVFFLAFCAPLFAQEKLHVFVNDRDLGVVALEENGVAYVPVMALALALKATILWNPLTNEIVVNGQAVGSDVFMKKGILYVPVEAIARGIGAAVGWNGQTHSIWVDTRHPAFPSLAQNNPLETHKNTVVVPPPPTNPPMPPPANTGFLTPRTVANADFSVTVTNVQSAHTIKDYYKSEAGTKFVIVSVSEQNISDQIQMYTGKFTLEDQNGNSYDYLDGLSNFHLEILRPGGINFGSLVFEIPENATPASLVLHTYGNPDLKVSLQ